MMILTKTASVTDLALKQQVPVTFYWNHGGRQVLLTGSWANWKERLPMELHGKIFTALVTLPIGIHTFKFIVDGVWQCAPDVQTVTDEQGNINNVISVTVPDRATSPMPAGWSEPPSPRTHHQGLICASEDGQLSPRNKPLKNQFLLRDVYGTETDSTKSQLSRRLLLVMVGLPARGKSFVARKLARYLGWLGYKTKVFNLGNYRREQMGPFQNHDFYRPDNPEGQAIRNNIAERALDDLMNWFREGGDVGVYDGTNSTEERRSMILSHVKASKKTIAGSLKTIFIEVICNDPQIIEQNIRATKLSSPDYVGMDPDSAVADFRSRIAHYEQAYETVQDDNLSYIKIFDVGRQMVVNRLYGFLPNRIAFFLNNLHIVPRPIYFTRPGETINTKERKLAGDLSLTENGAHYSEKLGEFMKSPPGDDDFHFDATKDLCVWSSTMKRAVQTSQHIPCVQYVRWKSLEELNVGELDGLTEAEIDQKFPDEAAARLQNRLTYRYPRGESYEDVIRRLEPGMTMIWSKDGDQEMKRDIVMDTKLTTMTVIIELERQRKPVIVVAHRAILRCLIAYFKEISPNEIPQIPVPLHTLTKLYPKAYGTVEKKYKLVESNYDDSTSLP